MTQLITVDRATLEQLVADILEINRAIGNGGSASSIGSRAYAPIQRALSASRAALTNAEPVNQMDEVAYRFAHPLALELECVLADRNANWDRAMNLIGEYRSAMNAIHEKHSPTHMGEPLLHNAGDKPPQVGLD